MMIIILSPKPAQPSYIATLPPHHLSGCLQPLLQNLFLFCFTSQRPSSPHLLLTESFTFQGSFLPGEAGGVPGGRSDVRHQDHRQEGAEGEGGLSGERDQSTEKVFCLNNEWGRILRDKSFQVGPSQRCKIIRSLRKPNLCLLSDGAVSCFTYFDNITFSGWNIPILLLFSRFSKIKPKFI